MIQVCLIDYILPANSTRGAFNQFWCRLRRIAALCCLCGLIACSAPPTTAANSALPVWWQPTNDSYRWYWQLQDTIVTSHDVDIYNIDIDTPQNIINALKSRGVRLICYFSVGTVETWRPDTHRFIQRVVGEPYSGYPDERWLDTGNYPLFADIMTDRLDRCAEKGFDGVEGDNVDAFLHVNPNVEDAVGTSFSITKQQSINYVLWLAAQSHKRGLAFGLKNAEAIAVEVVDSVDWMLTESCFSHGWCDDTQIFQEKNKPVFMTEYVEHLDSFVEACAYARRRGLNAIYRDTGLTAGGRFEECI